jgi:hypothetical protein
LFLPLLGAWGQAKPKWAQNGLRWLQNGFKWVINGFKMASQNCNTLIPSNLNGFVSQI